MSPENLCNAPDAMNRNEKSAIVYQMVSSQDIRNTPNARNRNESITFVNQHRKHVYFSNGCVHDF